MTTEPLTFSLTVECPPDRAFQLWTERIAMWWPKSHTMSGDLEVTVHFEPRLGGRVFERATDGREIDWGEVTLWEPPRRVVYWWHIGYDRPTATEVDVTFIATEADRTRVDLVHRGWDRIGEPGPERRERNKSGWGGVLPLYIAACARAGD